MSKKSFLDRLGKSDIYFNNEETIFHLQYNQKIPFQYLVFSELGISWLVISFLITDKYFNGLVLFIAGYIWVYRWFVSDNRMAIYNIFLISWFSDVIKGYKLSRSKKHVSH
jgi:hypothetical protein